MESASLRPKRKPTRIPGFDYAAPNWYFVTICTHKREHLFGAVVNEMMQINECGAIVTECWNALPAHYSQVELLGWVVMPNHVHGVIAIHPQDDGTASVAVSEVVRALKTFSAQRINRQRDTVGAPVWQRSFHDHIIRSERAFERIWDYIQTNPERWSSDTYYSDDADSPTLDNTRTR